MWWRKIILIGLGLIVLTIGLGIYVIRQSEYRLESSAAGSFLAAYQADLNKDYTSAGRYYDEARRENPRNKQVLREAMRAHLVSGQMPAALSSAQSLLNYEKNNGRALTLLALAAFKNGDFDGVRAYLDRLRPSPMSDLLESNIRLWLDFAQNERGAYSKAIDTLAQATALPVVSFMQAAHGAELMGDTQKAAQLYRQGVRAGGMRYLVFTLAYGDFLHRQSDIALAKKIYDYYNLTHAPHPTVLRARQLLSNSAKPPSRDALLGLTQLFQLLGEAMMHEKRNQLGLAYTHIAHYLDPSNMQVIYQIATLHEQQQSWRAAQNWYARIGENSPLFVKAQLARASTLNQMGNAEMAIAILSNIFAAHPNNREVLVALGDVYRFNARFSEAEKAYDGAIAMIDEEDNRFWHIYFSRGMVREQLGNWPRAERDLQKARILSGDEPHVLNYLGYSWVDRGIYLHNGLKIIKQAVKKRPDNGSFVDSLGWAYYRLGQYEQALIYLERATRLEPVDPIITDHLGDVLWRLGRKVEARYQWRKALGFNPEEKNHHAIEQKLIKGLIAPPTIIVPNLSDGTAI